MTCDELTYNGLTMDKLVVERTAGLVSQVDQVSRRMSRRMSHGVGAGKEGSCRPLGASQLGQARLPQSLEFCLGYFK